MTVLPQKSFNSYDAPSTDILGTPALWSSGAQRRTPARARHAQLLARTMSSRLSHHTSKAFCPTGDFMAHFAGADRDSKLRLVQKYLALVLPFDSATAATPGR